MTAGSYFQGFSLRLIAWVTLVGAPILILLEAPVIFLAYHDEIITWAQRLLLLLDLVVIWGFGTVFVVTMIESAAPC